VETHILYLNYLYPARVAMPTTKINVRKLILKKNQYTNIQFILSYFVDFVYFEKNCDITKFSFNSMFIEVLWDTQYFLFFHLVHRRINQKVFLHVSKPHRALHVRSMDSPNLIHTLVTIFPVLC